MPSDQRPADLPPQLDLRADDVVEAMEEIDDHDLAPAPTERTSGFDGVGTRREARERALSLLYEAEQRGVQPLAAIVDDLPLAPSPYTVQLVVGVSDHLAEIDELLERHAIGWTVARMPMLDRALLRLGCFELAHTDVPVGACISEAVELAKRYSTDDSHRFVNGLLAKLAAELRQEVP